MEEMCEYLYDSSRCCKILDASLKLDGTVFDHFHIALTVVETIKELSNDAFDRSLGFFFQKIRFIFTRFHIRFLADNVDNLF